MSTLNETTAKQNQAHSLAIDNSKLDEALTHLYQSQTKINKQMVINTLTQAKVLVPIALSSEAKSNAQGELIIDKDTQITLILLQNEQGANYCPVFTNETELSKYGAQKSGTLKQGFINIAQTVLKPNSNIAGIVVNPFGVSLTLDSDLLKAITNPVIKDPTPRSYKIESGTKVMIGEPKTQSGNHIRALYPKYHQYSPYRISQFHQIPSQSRGLCEGIFLRYKCLLQQI